MRLDRAPLILVVVLLVSSACAEAAPAPGTIATVNGRPAPKMVYDLLRKSTEAGMQKAGIPLRNGDPRVSRVEAAALKGSVHDAVVEQLAVARKVTATQAEVDDALTRIETALGGKNAFDQKLEGSGLDRREYAALYHYTLLEQKMRNTDPGYDKAFAKKLAEAAVQAYVGPCATNHEYPKCLGEA